jgi:hypothetical protein
MKNFSYLYTILMVLLASCSSGGGPKEITPTSTEFTSGELAKYIEVVDQPSKLTFAEQDGVIATQYIQLKVTLRMSKDGFKNVDAHDINFTGLLSVAIINLVDENGIDVKDLSIKDEDLLKLKKLLTGSEGDTEEIVFEGEYHNPDDAPEWFKQAKQFTPYLTGDVSVKSSSEIGIIDVPTEVSDVEDVMEQVSTVMEDVVEIMEDVEEGTNNSISSGSEDWDSLLDTYESYVDKYISYMKKAANGDMSALSEYPALMEKAQELSEKIDNAKDDMSSSQLKRYMEITMKMTNAVQ